MAVGSSEPRPEISWWCKWSALCSIRVSCCSSFFCAFCFFFFCCHVYVMFLFSCSVLSLLLFLFWFFLLFFFFVSCSHFFLVLLVNRNQLFSCLLLCFIVQPALPGDDLPAIVETLAGGHLAGKRETTDDAHWTSRWRLTCRDRDMLPTLWESKAPRWIIAAWLRGTGRNGRTCNLRRR